MSGKLTMAAGLFAGLASLIGEPARAQDAPLDVNQRAVWAGTSPSCAGLLVGWHPLLEPLAGLVGTNWQPAHGPIRNRGTFSILTVRCDDSTIDGASSGPIVVAFAIVPVVPYGQPGADPVDAFTHVVAPPGSKAAALFRRLGFLVLESAVELVYDETRDVPKATFAIASGATRISATADFPVGGTSRARHLRVVGTQPGVFSIMEGRSRSVATTGLQGIVLDRGTDLFHRLALEDSPPIVELGRNYQWEFHMQRGEFEPK